MDEVTKAFQAFLLRMRYEPETVPHTDIHHAGHLLALLSPDDEEAVTDYFGIMGHKQLSLQEIAERRKEEPEETMSHIDACLRKLAITPEWEMMAGIMKERKNQ